MGAREITEVEECIAPNNGPSKQQCALQTLKNDGVSLALDAAGFVLGESQTMAIVQLGISGAPG